MTEIDATRQNYEELWTRLMQIATQSNDRRIALHDVAGFVIADVLPVLTAPFGEPRSRPGTTTGDRLVTGSEQMSSAPADRIAETPRTEAVVSRPDPSSLPESAPRHRDFADVVGSANILSYVPGEVVVAARARLQSDAASADGLVKLLADLRATFALLEDRGSLTYENIGDSLVNLVRLFDPQALATAYPTLVGPLIDVGKAVVVGLVHEYEERPSIGRLQTIAMYADILAGQLEHLWAGAAYRYVLNQISSGTGVSGLRGDDKSLMVRAASNNFAASLGRWYQEHGQKPVDDRLWKLQSLSAISTPSKPSDDAVGVLEVSGRTLTAEVAGAAAGVLTTFGNTPLALAVEGSALSAVQTLSAPCAEISGRVEVAPARFFNAGVSLIRAPLVDGETMTDRQYLRITTNAFGLLWAFRASVESGQRAQLRGWSTLDDNMRNLLYEENDGFDCVVNLAGATSALIASESAPDALTRAAVEVLKVLSDFYEYPNAARVRVQGSFKTASLTNDEQTPFSAAGLIGALDAFVRAYDRAYDGLWRAVDVDDVAQYWTDGESTIEADVGVWIKLWRSVFATWIKATVDQELLAGLIGMAEVSLADTEVVDARLREIVGELNELDWATPPSPPDLLATAPPETMATVADDMLNALLSVS